MPKSYSFASRTRAENNAEARPSKTDEEKLTTWNSTQQPYEIDVCVPALVAQQAAATPDAVAIIHKNHRLTYRALEERAGQLALHLRNLGVGRDVVVGLCLTRSVSMIVGALAILKAGGAYLPIDPDYPPSRAEFILNDARVPILVGARCNADRLPSGTWQAVHLDAEGKVVGPQFVSPIAESLKAEQLAYVIYTSGSTGRPKGVEVTHSNLLNLVYWHQRAFEVTAQDRASQLSGVGFDAAVWELWPYLAAGASLHIPEQKIATDPSRLRDWILEERISVSFLPTPIAERVMELEWPAICPLRFLLTGADVLHHFPSPHLPFRLVNNYGPTECTVVATSGIVSPGRHTDCLPTIGRPIANTQIYILDESLGRVPIGTVGEIYIGGAGVSRGYHCRPDLTLERFVPDPFSSTPGSRLYRTGDRARFLPDGEIAFSGRLDDQIKIRGFRIEPNEIVTVLAEHPVVRESAIAARELAGGEKQLVAYVVLDPKSASTHTELRNFLATRLPEYMIPASFVRLESLPLNSSGKIDRSALPSPDLSNTLRDDSYIPPCTPTEMRVAAILAPLLGLERVGVADNFFLLGGHSLLGTQLIGRIRDAFDVELSLRTLFDFPTVTQISTEIERLLLAKLHSLSEEEAQQMLRAQDRG